VTLERIHDAIKAEQRPQFGDDLIGLPHQAPVGNPKHSIAHDLQGAVPDPIALEGLPCAVVLVAVELDHDALSEPDEVDLETRNEAIDQWSRQVGLPAKLEEEPLQLRPSRRRALVPGKHGSQPRHAAPPQASGKERLDCAQIEQLQTLRLIEGTFQLLGASDFGQVEQSARDRCDGYAVALSAIVGMKLSNAMDV
jgi:hypothetical protein